MCTLLAMGADNIIFAIDWPYEPNKAGMDFFEMLSISDGDREKIAHGNARAVVEDVEERAGKRPRLGPDVPVQYIYPPRSNRVQSLIFGGILTVGFLGIAAMPWWGSAAPTTMLAKFVLTSSFALCASLFALFIAWHSSLRVELSETAPSRDRAQFDPILCRSAKSTPHYSGRQRA